MKTVTEYYYEEQPWDLNSLFWLALAAFFAVAILSPMTFWERLATAVFVAACLCLMFWGRVKKTVVTVKSGSHRPTASALKGV